MYPIKIKELPVTFLYKPFMDVLKANNILLEDLVYIMDNLNSDEVGNDKISNIFSNRDKIDMVVINDLLTKEILHIDMDVMSKDPIKYNYKINLNRVLGSNVYTNNERVKSLLDDMLDRNITANGAKENINIMSNNDELSDNLFRIEIVSGNLFVIVNRLFFSYMYLYKFGLKELVYKCILKELFTVLGEKEAYSSDIFSIVFHRIKK